jgi:hypothetical protein
MVVMNTKSSVKQRKLKTIRKEYEEKVFDQEYDQQYEAEKFGKKATEVFATLDEFVNYAHGYIRDPDDPVTGVFGEYYTTLIFG